MDDKPTATTGPGNNVTLSEVETLKLQVKAMQQQLTDLDKSNGRAFEVLKWGMGMFITFAIVFAGFNWWSGKTNYDRDKEALKQEAALLAQGLALSQKDSATAAEKAFLELRTANEKQLAVIRADVETNVASMIAERAKQLESVALRIQSLATNLDSSVAAHFAEYNTHLGSELRSLGNTNSVAISNLLTTVDIGLSDARGISLLIQGHYLCKDNRAKDAKSFIHMVAGLASYASAGRELIKGSDEHNLEDCLARIVEYFPVLINNSSRTEPFPPEDLFNLGKGIDELLSALHEHYPDKYYGEAANIQSLNTLYKRLVIESRNGRVGGVKMEKF